MADGNSTGRIDGVVEWFDAEQGWGALSSVETPGGCFVHFSAIATDGYRALAAGQRVRFVAEHLDFLQDGYSYRAVRVIPSELRGTQASSRNITSE
ncbi:cold shock domain-containing protein [Flexivirga caeni]|uniref:Cold shock domain-containing protein n=1 Tax=Flexivirga caeni TaxID=2294115 RepID=A0A3M9M043_9MICO|nr:cold shock domain-containing protein [Flexivirga caeni]RNI17968.1 cold shock domain-containing protein [Flexivirga caeni]